MTTPTLSQLGEMKNDELQTILGDLVRCHRDYCSDANAVAEVRKGMTKAQKFKFGAIVSKLIAGLGHQCPPFDLIDANLRIQTISAIATLTP
jgi:hypothetical protein